MTFIRSNVNLGRPLRLTAWRKIAIGTWHKPGDPSVYGFMDVEIEPGLAYIEKIRKETGLRITLSHYMAKVMAELYRRHPDLNCVLRLGRLYPRKTIDVFFQVATDPEGLDLTGMVVRSADRKPIPEIAREMEERIQKIKRAQKDQEFEKMKGTMGLLPGWLSRTALKFSEFLMYALNLWSPLLGTPRDPFGSLMITNIGSLGLDMAFAPLVPYSRVPLIVCMGNIIEHLTLQDGQVRSTPKLRLSVTVDHRLIDGMKGSHMFKTLQKILANPAKELETVPSASS